MKRATLIKILGVSLVVVVIIIIFLRTKKNKEIAAINAALDNGTGANGNYNDLLGSNAFSTTYWQSFNFSDDNKQTAIALAKNIYDALGYFQIDDTQKVFDAFQSAGSKAFVSLISYEFQQQYGKSLDSHLSHLSSDDKNKVNQIVSNLPNT